MTVGELIKALQAVAHDYGEQLPVYIPDIETEEYCELDKVIAELDWEKNLCVYLD